MERESAPRKQLAPTAKEEFPKGREVIQIDPAIGEIEPHCHPGGCFVLVEKHYPELGETGIIVRTQGFLTLINQPRSETKTIVVPQAQTKPVGILKQLCPGARTPAGTVLWVRSDMTMTHGCFMVVRQVIGDSGVDGFIYQPKQAQTPEGKWNLHYLRVRFEEAYVVGKAPWVLSNTPALTH